jgi:hypothetical protein
MSLRKRVRRVFALAALMGIASAGIAATSASAHPPNTLMAPSVGVVLNGQLVLDFNCHAYALDAVAISILYCFTESTNLERHWAAPKSMPGPYVGTGAIGFLPILPYKICMRAVSVHQDPSVNGDTGQRCTPYKSALAG